jgi:hypothetical protein
MSEVEELDDNAEEIDFENIEEETEGDSGKRPDSFISILADFFTNVNYKLIIILFLAYVFLMSDLFLDKVLSKIDGAVSNRVHLTPKGTFINGVLLILLYMSADMLIRNKIV